MKSIIALFTISFFLSLITGCEKPLAEPEPQKNPTIEAWSDFSGIPYNGSCTITLKLTNTTKITSDFPGSENITLNEEPKSIALSTPKLTETTTYHFVAHGEKGLTDSANVNITVNPPIAPTISLNVDNDTIIRGTSPSSVKITWNSNTDSTSSPELSGVKGKSGTISVSPTETTIYHFISKNDGLIVSDSVRITVKDPPPPPPPTMEELLCNYGPWKMVKLEFQDGPGLAWYEADISDCRKDDLYYFYLTPTKKMVNDRGVITCYDGEPRTSDGPWSLNGNQIIDQSLILETITLNKDTLVWMYHPGGTNMGTKNTFIHP